MKFGYILLLALVSVAIVALVLRASFSSTSCTGAQEGVGKRGAPPAIAAGASQDTIAGWIANKTSVVVPPTTPVYEGTPPPGFATWDAFAQWALTYLQAGAPSSAQFQAVPGGSVGGIAALPNVKSSQSDCS